MYKRQLYVHTKAVYLKALHGMCIIHTYSYNTRNESFYSAAAAGNYDFVNIQKKI